MRENIQEKGLTKINENSIFYKIKTFFLNLFVRKESNIEPVLNMEVKEENNKNSFMEDIKNIENEETKLFKLQKQYHSGQILEKDLTDKQIKDLTNLYKKQNEEIRKSNTIREQKLLEYRRRLQTNN